MSSTPELSPHRWVIVFSAALMMAIAMGSIVNGMSAFMVPMQEAYGWQRAEISLINVAGIVGIACGGLVMGPQADRLGTRKVVFFGSVVLGSCYFLAGFATELWHYYVLMFAAGFLGAGAIFAPIMACVGNWFPVGAGLAIGIASAGQAMGQGAVPFISSLLIIELGIDWTLMITGIVMLAILVPLSLVLGPAPKVSAAAQNNIASEDAYPPFTLIVGTLSAAILLCCTCMSIPLMHLVPLIQDRGFPAQEAGSVIFLMLMVGIVGRVAFGKLADIIGALPAYMTATLWMTLMVFGFIYIETLSGFYAYAMVYGFGYAGVMTGVLVSVASLTHPGRRATAMGITGFFGWLGHANGGFLGGFLFDQTGSYSEAYAIATATGIANLIIVGTLFMYTRKPDRGGEVLAG